jgi:hypothetical protein
MADRSLEERVTALEQEVARLRELLEAKPVAEEPWWQKISGSFANDPIYEEAMRLGRKYRESLRPKPTRKKKRPRHDGGDK